MLLLYAATVCGYCMLLPRPPPLDLLVLLLQAAALETSKEIREDKETEEERAAREVQQHHDETEGERAAREVHQHHDE
eukprot:1858122-Rhodomonas_salina.1